MMIGMTMRRSFTKSRSNATNPLIRFVRRFDDCYRSLPGSTKITTDLRVVARSHHRERHRSLRKHECWTWAAYDRTYRRLERTNERDITSGPGHCLVYVCCWCVGLWWCDHAGGFEWLKLTDIVTGWSTVSGPVSHMKFRWGLNREASTVNGT